MNRNLPAEWHPQNAIQLTWPHENTDWAWVLEDIQMFYIKLINTILAYENVILSIPDLSLKADIESKLIQTPFQCVFFQAQSNDTWARDHGPIGVYENNKLVLKDFIFNGWGRKFEAELDNKITSTLFNQGAYPTEHITPINFVLEGGSIESDGNGCLLTTTKCLMNTNRNASLNQSQIEDHLKANLGCQKILWLKHGNLQGDDTDAHIDTLARFAPNNQIIYQGCNNPDDAHFDELSKMKAELSTFTNVNDEPFQLVELPWPTPQFDQLSKHRLPATYANFLFINNSILLPTYGIREDQSAIDILKQALPHYKIIPVDCSVVIRQFGSLHCLTMHIPQATQQ